ncbi:hypothetical protein ABT263_03165 [Kitasatospora sp. NPDC001603]|uniref:hypothetical protein n=1 Tax=Kitasatospora sp. NPDC001603 TaxID=3154388 RepID=UPI003329077F
MTTATTTARPARRPVPVRPTLFAAAAVLLLGAGLTACEGGAALCTSDNSCDVVVRTEGGDSTRTVEVFGGDRTVELTISHITDTAAEVKPGDDTRTVAEGAETAIGTAKITLRNANAHDHHAELHVSR